MREDLWFQMPTWSPASISFHLKTAMHSSLMIDIAEALGWMCENKNNNKAHGKFLVGESGEMSSFPTTKIVLSTQFPAPVSQVNHHEPSQQ